MATSSVQSSREKGHVLSPSALYAPLAACCLQAEDDYDVEQLEAAAPVGDTHAWGAKRTAASAAPGAGTASAARLRQLKQQREQQQQQQQLQQVQEELAAAMAAQETHEADDGGGAGAAAAAADALLEATQSGLVHEAQALFTSLRKLHELMSGPRGPDLSPRPVGGLASELEG